MVANNDDCDDADGSIHQMQMKFVLTVSTTAAMEQLMKHRQQLMPSCYTDDDGDGFAGGELLYTIVT